MTASVHVFRRPSSYSTFHDRHATGEPEQPVKSTTNTVAASTSASSRSKNGGGESQGEDERESDGLLVGYAPNNPDAESPGENTLKDSLSFSERHIFACIALVLLLFVSAVFLQEAPLTQIYELVLCQNYYGKSGHHHLLPTATSLSKAAHGKNPCKIDPIQSEVAWIKGIMKLMEFAPTIALALPFSRLSNRIGRKPVLLLSMLGVGLQYLATFTICWFGYILPLRLVFLAPLLTAIGGGATVTASVFYAIISDVVPVESLTNYYYSFFAVELVTVAVCRTASSSLMEWKIWSSIIIGNIAFLASYLVCLALPETRNLGVRQKHAPVSSSHNGDEASSQNEESEAHLNYRTRLFRSCKSASALFIRHRFVLLIFVLEFFFSFAERVSNFILLYISKRYDLSLAKANYFNSYLTVVNAIVLLAILPLISRTLLEKLHINPYYKAVGVVFGSCLLFLSGCVVLGLGRDVVTAVLGITLFGLGIGGTNDLRTLMIMFAPSDQYTLCHTVFNLFRDLAEAISGPLYSFTFSRGLQLGGHWIGMPFQVAAIVFALVTTVVLIVWIRSATARVSLT